MELSEILSRCDHTLLRVTATNEEIRALCDEAIEYGCASVCIPACHVKGAKAYVGEQMKICTVIGFPNGYSTPESKAFEAADAISELINAGHVSELDGRYVITSTGREIAELLRTDVPLTVREKVLAKAARLFRRQVNLEQHHVEIMPREDGFIVRGSISDFGSELFAVEVYAPNRLHAENIRDNFIDKGADIMRDALSRLVVPAEEL